MVSTPPVRPLRLATKALRNSVANTAACSANLRCETFERFFLQVLRNSNWSVVSKRHGRPAVKAAKIQKRVGFHTFRHTYTTLLTQNNEQVKVVQELLRHANSRITLDLYAQAGMPNKRLAQSKLVRMVLNKGEALA